MNLSELQSRVIDEVRSIGDDKLIALGIVLGVISQKEGAKLLIEDHKQNEQYLEAKRLVKEFFGLGD